MPFKRSTVVDVSDDQRTALVRYDDGTFGVVKRDAEGRPCELSCHETSTAALEAFARESATTTAMVN